MTKEPANQDINITRDFYGELWTNRKHLPYLEGKKKQLVTVFGDSVFLAEWPQKMRELSDQGISFGVANWPFVAELGFEDAVAALEILLSRPLSNRQRAVQRFVLSLLLTDMGRPRAVAVLAGQGTPGPLAIWTALLSDGDTARANEAARKMLEEQLAPRPTDEDRLNSLLRNNAPMIGIEPSPGNSLTSEAISLCNRPAIAKLLPSPSSMEVETRRVRIPGTLVPSTLVPEVISRSDTSVVN